MQDEPRGKGSAGGNGVGNGVDLDSTISSEQPSKRIRQVQTVPVRSKGGILQSA